MTEERLQSIIDEISCNGTRIMRPYMVMKAMKQAVNEALDEAVELAPDNEALRKDRDGWVSSDSVRNGILKLKVK